MIGYWADLDSKKQMTTATGCGLALKTRAHTQMQSSGNQLIGTTEMTIKVFFSLCVFYWGLLFYNLFWGFKLRAQFLKTRKSEGQTIFFKLKKKSHSQADSLKHGHNSQGWSRSGVLFPAGLGSEAGTTAPTNAGSLGPSFWPLQIKKGEMEGRNEGRKQGSVFVVVGFFFL